VEIKCQLDVTEVFIADLIDILFVVAPWMSTVSAHFRLKPTAGLSGPSFAEFSFTSSPRIHTHER